MLQPGLRSERDQRRHCPLFRRHGRHHTHILASFEVRRVRLAEDDAVDQQAGVARAHGVGDDPQDFDALGVGPVVQDGGVVVEAGAW
jgi:hypothetical protein